MGRKRHDRLFSSGNCCSPTASTATAWSAGNNYSTTALVSTGLYILIQHHQRQDIYLRDEGPALPTRGLASPPLPPPQHTTRPPSPIHVNRLPKTDPHVLAIILRCRCEEVKTTSPIRMSCSSSCSSSCIDEHRYLPKTTASSGFGLHSTNLLLRVPGHSTLSTPRLLIGELHPRSSQDVWSFQVPAMDPQTTGTTAALVLTAQLPLGSRDSPAMKTKDSQS